MMIFNPPLRVGQTLKAKPGRKIGDCRIIGYVFADRGFVWSVENKIGDQVALTLSAIWQLFQFEGQTPEDD